MKSPSSTLARGFSLFLSHLGEFCFAMDLLDDTELESTLTNDQIKTLSIVYVSTLSLSLLGSLSVLVASIACRQRLNVQVRPLLQLALADTLASGLLLFSSAANLVPLEQLRHRIKMCEFILPLCLMFYCVSFLLVVVYAHESKQAAEGWRERAVGDECDWRGSGLACFSSYIIVWLVPLVIYIIYVSTQGLTEASLIIPQDGPLCNKADNNYTLFCSSCVLLLHITNDSCSHVDPGHDTFVKTFLLVTLTVALLCCTVMYQKVSTWLRKQEAQAMLPLGGDGFTQKRLRGLCVTTRSMLLVVIGCWAPALCLVGLSFFQSFSQKKLFPLYVTQAITVSLHGFLNSVVYGWLRQNFREAMQGERMPLLAKAFYEESLTEH